MEAVIGNRPRFGAEHISGVITKNCLGYRQDNLVVYKILAMQSIKYTIRRFLFATLQFYFCLVANSIYQGIYFFYSSVLQAFVHHEYIIMSTDLISGLHLLCLI